MKMANDDGIFNFVTAFGRVLFVMRRSNLVETLEILTMIVQLSGTNKHRTTIGQKLIIFNINFSVTF